MHIELFSHLTGLAAFHQSALHVLQPGEGKRGEREGGNEKFGKREGNRGEERQKRKCLKGGSGLNTQHLGQFRSKTWGRRNVEIGTGIRRKWKSRRTKPGQII